MTSGPPPPPGMMSAPAVSTPTPTPIPTPQAAPTPDPRVRTGMMTGAPIETVDNDDHDLVASGEVELEVEDSSEEEAPESVIETPEEPETKTNPTQSDTDERVVLLQNAAVWYIETLGVTLIPGHFPKDVSSSPTLVCSCGNSECEAPAKHPAIPSYKRASSHITTAEAARKTWADNPWNIFVLVGDSQGLLVFDIDPRHGGDDSFKILKANLEGVLDFDNTYHYTTSSGGRHYYFKVDRDDREAWGIIKGVPFRIMPGIEFKRSFGYVVAAPSRHASGDYYTRPSTSPLAVTELDRDTIHSLSQKYRGEQTRARVRTSSAVPTVGSASSSLGTWADLAASNDQDLENVGVAFGGSAGYDDVVQQVIDQVPGSAARLVSYFWVHGEIPGSLQLSSGSGLRNIVLSNVIRRLAELYFGHPKAQTELRYLLEQAGADLRQPRSCPVPSGYLQMAVELDKSLCVEPYAESKPGKFREIVSSSMVTALLSYNDD